MSKVLYCRLGFKRATRRLKKRVDVLLLNTGRGLVELRLDGDPLTVITPARHQVNTGVRLATVVAPLIPPTHLIKLRRQHRIRLEKVDHQLLKRNAVLALGLVIAELIEDFTE